MPRSRSVTRRIPPRPPARMELSQRPKAVLDLLCAYGPKLWNEPTDAAEEFRTTVTTMDTTDSVHGSSQFDACQAARIFKEYVEECGVNMDGVNLKQIANKFQWWLRRQDTAEIAFSRRERERRLAAPAAAPTIDASEAGNSE